MSNYIKTQIYADIADLCGYEFICTYQPYQYLSVGLYNQRTKKSPEGLFLVNPIS